MHFLFVLAASPAIMILLFAGQIAAKGDCPAPNCTTPTKPFYRNLSHTNVSLYYIYNATSHLCEYVLIEKCHNTFDSRFSCVSQCKTGQGARECIGDPVNACNNYEITSNPVSTPESQTDPQGDDGDNDDEYYSSEIYDYDSSIKFIAYFYNATAMRCQGYFAYEVPNRSEVTNYFEFRPYCRVECGGFNVSTINGSKTDNTT
uniref:Putative kunitz-like peptide n=1 Tax=Rhipicephalus pulchellus TaxID=72859 RepID=L7MBX5_RHIPC